MIEVTDNIVIPEAEISIEFIRSAGPGGQNVNKVATAAQLRFDVINSAAFSDLVRQRLIKLAGKKINSDGIIVITARKYRSQARNRQAAIERLVALIRAAAAAPKKRIPTKPGTAVIEKRLLNKRIKSALKKSRQDKKWPEE